MSQTRERRWWSGASDATSGVTWRTAGAGQGGRGRRSWSMSAKVMAALCAALPVVPMVMSTSASAAAYDPATDPYSMSSITQTVGATAWWNAGYTGRGVDVAVIDTGVAPVQGLSSPGKMIYGPDLSLESQAPNLRNLDTNGHGTFMAGLIAGRDDALDRPLLVGPCRPVSGHRPRRPDRGVESGHCRWRGRRVTGDRGDQLGGGPQDRQRDEHPGPEPVLRDRLDPICGS